MVVLGTDAGGYFDTLMDEGRRIMALPENQRLMALLESEHGRATVMVAILQDTLEGTNWAEVKAAYKLERDLQAYSKSVSQPEA